MISKAIRQMLIDSMKVSAQKGNLANAGAVVEQGKLLAIAESWVVSACDATAHSERMLVSHVCNQKRTSWTPGLTMISVVEPCLMCMSACAQAGYAEIKYILPAANFVKTIPWMTDTESLDKEGIAQGFSHPLRLTHESRYEHDFEKVFIQAMHRHFCA